MRFVPDYYVPNRYNCYEMRTIIKISILLIFLLSACNFPKPEQPTPGSTVAPEAESARETETPSQDHPYTECAFAWAREPLADLSKEFDEALKEVHPQVSGRAEAYGENCLNDQGEVARFLAMETDFYVTLQVKDLEDKQALGELIEQVLTVVARFPPEDTPGPQPGYVRITFVSRGDELRLWFTQVEAKAVLGQGLQGEELYYALQAK